MNHQEHQAIVSLKLDPVVKETMSQSKVQESTDLLNSTDKSNQEMIVVQSNYVYDSIPKEIEEEIIDDKS